jgi:hypothetical protein
MWFLTADSKKEERRKRKGEEKNIMVKREDFGRPLSQQAMAIYPVSNRA